ncbi:MAG: NUDIX domain-containing protein [Bacillota bacterium]|nr:NUDIX domain-containing protein [Bacillota bacterium]
MAVWYTGDLHLGHANIIRHCSRPFATVDEMNETLVANWQARVAADDQVYILGDLFFRLRGDPVDWLSRLPGQKHLIIGNHDTSWLKGADYGACFASMRNLSSTPERRSVCHYPLMSRPDPVQIYGHLHNNRRGRNFPLLAADGRALNAGVEINGYAPVSFRELVNNNARFANLWHERDGRSLTDEAAVYQPRLRLYDMPELVPSRAKPCVRIVVIAATSRGRLLLVRSPGEERPGPPAGHREPGETPLAAARRELVEETGALDWRLEPVCYYSVAQAAPELDPTHPARDVGAYGLLCRAEIAAFGPLRHEVSSLEFRDLREVDDGRGRRFWGGLPAADELRHGDIAAPLLNFALTSLPDL